MEKHNAYTMTFEEYQKLVNKVSNDTMGVEWECDEGEDNFEITDIITLRHTSDWCDGFPLENDDYWKWIKFLCDKGISPYYEALKEKEEND